MARQFIAGKNPRDVMKTLRKRRAKNIGFTVDLLGEAVVSEREATEYAARCFELLEYLVRETQGWTDPLGKNSASHHPRSSSWTGLGSVREGTAQPTQ